MSITLYLLNKKGYLCLANLLKQNDFKNLIDKVVTANDKGNKEDYCDEITRLCLENKLKVYKKNESFTNTSEYSIAIGWIWLIKEHNNLIVLHDSILPKYRGFAPLPNMLINGEKEIGATAIFANKEMDKGNIIFSEKTTIQYPLLIKDAIDKMSLLYMSLILKIFKNIASKKVLPYHIQNEKEATYSVWRDHKDYFIDWTKDAKYIERFVNAVGFPYDGAKTYVNEKEIITIHKVKALKTYKLENYAPGKILTYENEHVIVICGSNTLKILEAKDEHGINYEFNKLRTRLT